MEDVWVKFDHADEPPSNKFICDDSIKRQPDSVLGYAHSKCYDQIKAPYVRGTHSTDRLGSVVRCPKCARLVSYSRVFSKSAAPISIIKRTRPSISSVSSMGGLRLRCGFCLLLLLGTGCFVTLCISVLMDMGIPVFLLPIFFCAVLLVGVASENDKMRLYGWFLYLILERPF
jgi:hypothetical protein